MTNNTMREALLKFGDENPALDLDFRLHTHGKYLTQEKAIVASRAFKAGAAWQAARTVPDAAASILADVINALENGFVRCETCGDQEDTATLDCMDDLRKIHAMLSAAPAPKEDTSHD